MWFPFVKLSFFFEESLVEVREIEAELALLWAGLQVVYRPRRCTAGHVVGEVDSCRLL